MVKALPPKTLYLAFLILLASCATNRNLVYFSNINASPTYQQTIGNRTTPVIQPDDILSINVNSPNAESNALLNNGLLLPANNATTGSDAAHKAGEGYLVDKDGTIKFPILGIVKLGGLTREEATVKMTSLIEKSVVKSPIVNITFLNFRVTVLGEVNKPSSFIVPNEHVTLLEALGLAGDMTPYGERENVLVIREKDGKRNVTRLDLTNQDTFNSPYFYLQQNDVVYVGPNKARSLLASSRSVNLPIYLSVASVIVVLISSLLYRL